VPEFKDGNKQAMVDVNRTLEMTAPDHTMKRHLDITVCAKKFKGIGHDILLCKAQVPLARFLEKHQEAKKMRVILKTPSDEIPLAVMFLNMQKVGYRMDGEDDLT